MTGSRKAFAYEADTGVVYGVTKDESKAEATAGGVTLFANFTNGLPNLPCGLKKRYVNVALSTDATIRAVFEIGRKIVFDALTNGSQIIEAPGGAVAGATWNVTNKVGESARLLSTFDSGQIDGDQP